MNGIDAKWNGIRFGGAHPKDYISKPIRSQRKGASTGRTPAAAGMPRRDLPSVHAVLRYAIR